MTMSPRARARMNSIILVVIGLSFALGLALYGLRGNITFFHSPSDIRSGTISERTFKHTIRIGGLLKPGTLTREGDVINFSVTDEKNDVRVVYRGLVPDLFREGQGIVVYGKYDPVQDTFFAEHILAKHDENYMPREVKDALDRARTP